MKLLGWHALERSEGRVCPELEEPLPLLLRGPLEAIWVARPRPHEATLGGTP